MCVFEMPEFDRHEEVLFHHDLATGLSAIIAIHSTVLGPAAGGFRMWPYASSTEAVTDMLVERGDREVVHSVVKNVGAHFSDAGFRILVERSAGDDDLATEGGMRSDVPRPYFLVLLQKTSSAVRSVLLKFNWKAIQAALAK